MTEKRDPLDASWAIVGRLSTEVFEEVGRDMAEWAQTEEYYVLTGKDGFAALLAFGGSADTGDYYASKLARRGPVYSLDFNDEAPSIQEFKKTRTKYLKGNPFDFLEQRGFEGFHARILPTVPTAGVVEGITVAQAKRVCPGIAAHYAEHSRGVLVSGGAASSAVIVLSIRCKRRGYALYYNPEGAVFSCTICEPEGEDKWFTTGEPSVTRVMVESVLGETTMDGILRALEIPRELLQ